MKTLKKITFIFSILITFQFADAQEFTVPENYRLEAKEDYARYNSDVINCINWMEATPLDNSQKRKDANAFLLKWIAGSPTVSISLGAVAAKLTEKNPELLIAFLGGCTKFIMENPSSQNNVAKVNLAGVRSLIKVYRTNVGKSLKKDKEVDKLIEMEAGDKLEKWVDYEMDKG